jgi:hypothetical protein
LAEDCTSDTLLGCLAPVESAALEGDNGHLLSRLVAGRMAECLVVTVPGPQAEATAAARAVAECLGQGTAELRVVVERMAEAVLGTYPQLE